jgi:hypothetical protein
MRMRTGDAGKSKLALKGRATLRFRAQLASVSPTARGAVGAIG